MGVIMEIRAIIRKSDTSSTKFKQNCKNLQEFISQIESLGFSVENIESVERMDV
jgi:hypothetical protein